jgi:hypothetical protein
MTHRHDNIPLYRATFRFLGNEHEHRSDQKTSTAIYLITSDLAMYTETSINDEKSTIAAH